MSPPLRGIKVVDLTRVLAGPTATMLLADLGADVIKIEDPKTGDPMRQWGRSLPKGLSPWWPVIGRNKKSVTLDLRKPEGRDIARALIGKTVGDSIEVRTPGGEKSYEVLNVSYS